MLRAPSDEVRMIDESLAYVNEIMTYANAEKVDASTTKS